MTAMKKMSKSNHFDYKLKDSDIFNIIPCPKGHINTKQCESLEEFGWMDAILCYECNEVYLL